jgi:hypothetical protein
MKYLKSYKIYESGWIRDDVKEYLVYLEDEGFDIRTSYVGSGSGYIYVRKPMVDKSIDLLPVGKAFNIDDVRDDILRMISITLTTNKSKVDMTVDEFKKYGQGESKNNLVSVRIDLFTK